MCSKTAEGLGPEGGSFILKVFYFEGGLCKALPFAGLKNCLFQKDLHNKPYMHRERFENRNSSPLGPGTR